MGKKSKMTGMDDEFYKHFKKHPLKKNFKDVMKQIESFKRFLVVQSFFMTEKQFKDALDSIQFTLNSLQTFGYEKVKEQRMSIKLDESIHQKRNNPHWLRNKILKTRAFY